VILPGNEKLVLVPYHTYYPTLEEHLQGPWGIPIEPNLWNDPLVLGEKAFRDQYAKQSHNDQLNRRSNLFTEFYSPKTFLVLI